MAFTKDKNLIKYQGKNYQISYDFKSGILETNHPAKNKFIRQTAKRNINSLSNVICLASISDKKLNPFIETMALQAPNILKRLAYEATMFTDINHYIKLAKNNWKKTLELEKTYKTTWRTLFEWEDSITTLKLNLNELESKLNNQDSFILIITQTGCSHCEAYLPVVQNVSNKYKVDFYVLNRTNIVQKIYNIVLKTLDRI